MILEPIPWLPAAQPGEIADILDRAAARWLAEWFADPPRHRTEPVAGDAAAIAWSGTAALAVGASALNAAALGNHIADRAGDLANPRDAELLTAVGNAAVLAFATHLHGMSGTEHGIAQNMDAAPFGAGSRYRMICAEGGWSIDMMLDDRTSIALRKHRAGRGDGPELVGLFEALADEDVALGCHLGKAALSAGELDQLAIGDLIVLDRRTDEALALTLHGEAASRGKATLAAQDDRVLLHITETPELAR
jgi:hypothetical protein